MKCEHCGLDERKFQKLTQDIAEREAEFNALHVMWKNVSGALCDAETVVVYERDYARSVRELTAERDALKAQLAHNSDANAMELMRLQGELKDACADRDECKAYGKLCEDEITQLRHKVDALDPGTYERKFQKLTQDIAEREAELAEVRRGEEAAHAALKIAEGLQAVAQQIIAERDAEIERLRSAIIVEAAYLARCVAPARWATHGKGEDAEDCVPRDDVVRCALRLKDLAASPAPTEKK